MIWYGFSMGRADRWQEFAEKHRQDERITGPITKRFDVEKTFMTQTRAVTISAIEERVGVSTDYIKRELFSGRRKRKLGDAVGLHQFGVNHTVLEPRAYSALRHWHEGEDEFIFVLEGQLTLIDEHGEHVLEPGSVCGFPAGEANAHHLMNAGDSPAVFIEVGSRRPGQDKVHYPDDNFGPIER